MAKFGGKQEGAGRPKGATTRPQLRDFMTDAEIKKFMRDLLKNAKTDMGLQKFVAEQILGKAPQALELGGADGKDLTIQVVNYGDTTRKIPAKTVPSANQ